MGKQERLVLWRFDGDLFTFRDVAERDFAVGFSGMFHISHFAASQFHAVDWCLMDDGKSDDWLRT